MVVVKTGWDMAPWHIPSTSYAQRLKCKGKIQSHSSRGACSLLQEAYPDHLPPGWVSHSPQARRVSKME